MIQEMVELEDTGGRFRAATLVCGQDNNAVIEEARVNTLNYRNESSVCVCASLCMVSDRKSSKTSTTCYTE